MLVIDRRIGERIAIGDEIVITVVRKAKGKVRIGIDAPREVLVLREELLDREPPSRELSSRKIEIGT